MEKEKYKKLKKTNYRGITLIELVITIFIFSVILLASVAVASSYLKSRISLKKQQQGAEELTVVLNDMSKKLRMSNCGVNGSDCNFSNLPGRIDVKSNYDDKYITYGVLGGNLLDGNNNIVAENVNVRFYVENGIGIPRITISINKIDFPKTILQTTVSMRGGYNID